MIKIGVWKPQKYVGSVKIYYENIKTHLQSWGVEMLEFGINDKLPNADIFWDPTCTDGKSPNKKFLKIKNPIVATIHGAASFSLNLTPSSKNPIKFWLKMAKRKWLWIKFPKKALSVITVSKYAEKEIKDHLPLKKVLFLPIYHGYNDKIFFNNDAVERKHLLHISAYQKKKNVENIIAAYQLIPRLHRKPLLLVVPNFPNIEPIEGITIIREKQSQDEVANLMREAIAFIFPSLHESFGMPLIEAMACGCPLITSNVTACPEIVDNAGLLVDPNNIVELKEAIIEVSNNKDLASLLLKKSLERATFFSWEKSAKQHLDFFNEIAHLG